MDPRKKELSDAERELQAQFDPAFMDRFSSTAQEVAKSEIIEKLVLPENERGPMPFTQERLVIAENPMKVQWEREVRRFIKNLPGEDGHRITAPMIYEWTTGIKIADLAKLEGIDENSEWRGGARYGSANVHLRHINAILRDYFGKPYKTTILGRSVGRAYTVRPYFRIKDKRPTCLTLLPEFQERTLDE